jgi:glycosyltransferase involved in cell wall biosynthesis
MESSFDVAMVVVDRRKTDPWIYKIDILSPRKTLLKKGIDFAKRKFGIIKKNLQTDPLYVFLPDENENIQRIHAKDILNLISFMPDIIFSGITPGFMNTSTLLDLHKITKARIIQVMVDVSLLTGGCHVVWDCEGFKTDCKYCPAIVTKTHKLYSHNNLQAKLKNIENGDFNLLVLPGWSEYMAQSSKLYKNRIIVQSDNIIDTDIFSDKNRMIAKSIFNIEHTKKVIFAGSNNTKDIRKGRIFLVEALELLWNSLDKSSRNNVIILLAGNHNREDQLIKQIKFKKRLIDFITDNRLLSLLYQASDIYVSPSLEEGGPMMVPEALACGTPVVGFETGSLFNNSLVENAIHGYKVKTKDSLELANSIKNILELNESDFEKMKKDCRDQAIKKTSYRAFLKSIEAI